MVEVWVAPALGLAFLHALVSVLDKKLLTRYALDSLSITTFRLGLNCIVSLLIVLTISKFLLPPVETLTNIVILSILYAGGVITYFSALKTDDVSQLIPFREANINTAAYLKQARQTAKA